MLIPEKQLQKKKLILKINFILYFKLQNYFFKLFTPEPETIPNIPYIVRYRARTHISHACTAHIPQRRRLRLIAVACRAHRPWLPLPHIPCGRPIMQCIGSLGRGLGDGSCTSGGLNYVCRKCPLCSSYRVVSKS